ncbi:MAG: hypothetical protein ACLFVU_10820 [Phycisphaerae bacterium]
MRNASASVIAAAIITIALLSPAAIAEEAVQAKVTGEFIDINGHTKIPVGLFGVHAMKDLDARTIEDWGIEMTRVIHWNPGGGPTIPTEGGKLEGLEMVIDCQGDRYCPATVLTDPDYKAFFTRKGKEFARKCEQAGWTGWTEFWNEPYLNWASKSRINYQSKFYDASNATEGGPVTIKGQDEPVEHLRWRSKLRAVSKRGEVHDNLKLPEGAKPGDTFEAADKRAKHHYQRVKQTFTVKKVWEVYDPTQVSWFSGKQNLEYYMWMFLPYAKAVKETNPDVQVIGGWGFHIYMSGWSAWRELYKPMIDRSIKYLDGVHEHHYGSDPRATAASYQVVLAYGMSVYDKWLHCYNTETSGKADPQMPGVTQKQLADAGLKNAAAAHVYSLRDIMQMLARCPDVAASRAAHSPRSSHWGAGGDEMTFKLLKDLRGRLVRVVSPDPELWIVAAVNDDQLVIAAFNDSRSEKLMDLSAAMPKGTRAGERMTFTRVQPDLKAGKLELKTEQNPAATGDAKAAVKCRTNLTGKSGLTIRIPLTGKPAAGVQVRRTQHFAKGVLDSVKPGSPVTKTVKIPAGKLKNADAAGLKLVLMGAAGAKLQLNGKTIALPSRSWINEIEIAPNLLRDTNTLQFTAAEKPWTLGMCSIVIDRAE